MAESIHSPPRAGRCCRWQLRIAAVIFGLCAVLAGWGIYQMTRAPSNEPPAESDAKSDEQYGRMVVGTWEDLYRGKRTMTLREDGSGTMLVELSGMDALFASRLRFDMLWSVDEGRLKKRTVGGEPAWKVQSILKMMGDRVDEPILELTEDRLLLRDQDGKTEYDWRRVKVEQ
jgi:hypothetical protein